MDILLSCVLLAAVIALQGPVAVVGDGKCTYTREFKMLGANCFNQNFEEIPQNLNKDIEILYAAKNRIRKITNSSLRDYTSLKLLYLGDNLITKIEPGAFSELTDLEVLDLSLNAVHTLPTDLPLPLRKLYLADNIVLQNISLTAAFNLAYLNMAGCELRHFPSLGTLPNLKELNLTSNPLESVTPADLAPLCRLEKLYLPPTLYHLPGVTTQCQCHRLLTWTSQRYIALPGFNCTALDDPDAAACNVDMTEEMKIFKTCLVATPASTTRYLLIGVLIGALVAAFVIVVCWWRKSRRKKNSVQDQKRSEKTKNAKSVDTLIT
ncbi:decorin-like [Macrosteles quadrilineatus]|uniref:decorin-like n=1 Tax=Macrosteles quadrilineatus TaxID=74068 RepID=UPI0023E15F65|nr:decorin-like [Macrosteles quadrilineatus]XP_054290712.1 decorin-like [Macrosteles quadrilineatus]